jgi:hypothetical protein
MTVCIEVTLTVLVVQTCEGWSVLQPSPQGWT